VESTRIVEKDQLGIAGLGILEARELTATLGQQGRFVPPEQLPAALQGELGTSALVLLFLSPTAVAGLISWLLKRRVKEDIEVDLMKRAPDGSTTTIHVKARYLASSEPGEQALKLAEQIGKHAGISTDAILEAIGPSEANR
jgi:hypothetical protein